jgi:hypothetical protein
VIVSRTDDHSPFIVLTHVLNSLLGGLRVAGGAPSFQESHLTAGIYVMNFFQKTCIASRIVEGAECRMYEGNCFQTIVGSTGRLSART